MILFSEICVLTIIIQNQKKNRGLGDRIGIYDDDHFKKYNKYDIEDYSMKPFISELRNRIVKYPNIR